MSVLSVDSLVKRYGPLTAVDGVTFAVGPGETVGLLGPNGAGKTTVINMVLGVLAPDGGRVLVEGRDLSSHRPWALARMNFAAVYAPLPGNLTVEQNLRVFSLFYDLPRAGERVDELIERFDLVRLRRTKCGALSSGEQTRVSLAKALLNRPRLLLLDEPTASIDPASARHIRSLIAAYVKETDGGVLWTSHNMHEVATVCDRVLFLSHGRVLLEGNPRDLPERHGKATLEDLFVTVAMEPLSLEDR